MRACFQVLREKRLVRDTVTLGVVALYVVGGVIAVVGLATWRSAGSRAPFLNAPARGNRFGFEAVGLAMFVYVLGAALCLSLAQALDEPAGQTAPPGAPASPCRMDCWYLPHPQFRKRTSTRPACLPRRGERRFALLVDRSAGSGPAGRRVSGRHARCFQAGRA